MPLEEMVWRSDFSGKGHLLEVESGRAVPTLTTLAKLARALEVELIDLVNFPEQGLRHRLLELTRHLSQEAVALLVQHAEQLHDEENPPR
jgi:transcriptional regulator with XRE-family HTH domain